MFKIGQRTTLVGESDPSLRLTLPKTSTPPSLLHLVNESRGPGGKGAGVPPPEGFCVASASTLLGRASGYDWTRVPSWIG